MPQSATEGKSANTGCGHDSSRHGEAEGMRSVIDIAQGAASSHSNRLRFGIDVGVANRREIDDQRIIPDAEPACVVPPAPDCNNKSVFATKVDGRDNIGAIRAADNYTWVPVDHAVVNLAGAFILFAIRLDQLSPQLGPELFCYGLVEHGRLRGISSVRSRCSDPVIHVSSR